MSRKNLPVKEIHPSSSSLKQVDFKAGHLLHGKGFLCFSDLPRIAEEIQKRVQEFDPLTQSVDWELDSWIDEIPGGELQYRIGLKVQLSYPLECQRCLQNYEEDLQIVSQFILKNTIEEVEACPLDNDDEDALLNSHQFDLIELLEDEILLNIPLIPKHPQVLCDAQYIYVPQIMDAENLSSDLLEESKTAKNPFSSLKKLKFDA
jgi:uncharacterized protein